MAMSEYATRAKEYNFATRDELSAILSDASTRVVWMDVRTSQEIATDGRVHPRPGTNQSYVHVTDCTPEACPSLSQTPQMYVDATTTSTPPTIVVYCKSGRRARTACDILLKHGTYGTSVLNAGGYADIKDLWE